MSADRGNPGATRSRASGLAILLAACACAGCAATPVAFERRAVDWNRVPLVEIRNLPTNFAGTRAPLRVGVPVRLVIVNGFGPTADFVSTFFRTVRFRPGSPTPTLVLRLDPAQRAELDVIPERAGTYSISVIGYGVPDQPVVGDIRVAP